MKSIILKKVVVNIDLKLDSSEAIMFGKGGKFTCELNPLEICYDSIPLEDHKINVTIQMEDIERYRFIQKEADRHRARQANLREEEEQELEEDMEEEERKYTDFSDLKVPAVRML